MDSTPIEMVASARRFANYALPMNGGKERERTKSNKGECDGDKMWPA